VFQQAMDGARTTLSEGDWPVLDHLEKSLGGQPWRQRPVGRERKILKHACVRFQQLTSPAAAKAVEDTAFYRSAVLLSRNDVGFSTEQFSAPLTEFHSINQQRLEAFPDNLLATATHDHKRGEDTRARLAVLSECADWYVEQVEQWRTLAAPLRSDADTPSAGDELILYQVLLGSWPLDQGDDFDGYQQRLWQWQQKALREAKLNSSWSAPNDAYEQGVEAFLSRLLLSEEGRTLRTAIAAAAQAIAPAGALNGLAQSLLRMTVPGVPDLYQGAEFWDFSLVDPDNRRPVDFSARQRALETPTDIGELLFNWRDGRIKQAVIAQVLALRKAQPELFRNGTYTPLEVVGQHAERVVAFCREHQGKRLLVVVPRWSHHLLENGVYPQINAQVWGDTRLKLPFAAPTQNWKGLFHTGAVTPDKELLISTALGDFPVNVFINPDDQES
jgi:(1->4)-alpha-D-glucan 1-alpha-D-glucosylmutase